MFSNQINKRILPLLVVLILNWAFRNTKTLNGLLKLQQQKQLQKRKEVKIKRKLEKKKLYQK